MHCNLESRHGFYLWNMNKLHVHDTVVGPAIRKRYMHWHSYIYIIIDAIFGTRIAITKNVKVLTYKSTMENYFLYQHNNNTQQLH